MQRELVNELVRHMVWADVRLMEAVEAATEAQGDEELVRVLNHVVFVQRLFASVLRGESFDIPHEAKRVESLEGLRELMRGSHRDLLEFTGRQSDESLAQPANNAWRPQFRGSVRDVLMQVVLHSQSHRGQCLARLRALTGKAPTLDHLLWVEMGRPSQDD